jgi:hypothetical protein
MLETKVKVSFTFGPSWENSNHVVKSLFVAKYNIYLFN